MQELLQKNCFGARAPGPVPPRGYVPDAGLTLSNQFVSVVTWCKSEFLIIRQQAVLSCSEPLNHHKRLLYRKCQFCVKSNLVLPSPVWLNVSLWVNSLEYFPSLCKLSMNQQVCLLDTTAICVVRAVRWILEISHMTAWLACVHVMQSYAAVHPIYQ